MPSNTLMDRAKGVIREKGKKVFMDKFIDRHREANRSTNRQIQMAMQRQVTAGQNDPTTDPDRTISAARRTEAAMDLELFGTAKDNRTDPNSPEGLRLRQAALIPGSSAAAPPVRARNPTTLVSTADLDALLGNNKEALDAANTPQKKGRKLGAAGNNNSNNKERAGAAGRGRAKKTKAAAAAEHGDMPSFSSSAYPGAPTDDSIIPRHLIHVNRGFWPKKVRERVEAVEAAEAEAAHSGRAERRRAGAAERRRERERVREMIAEKERKRLRKRDAEKEMKKLRKRELKEREEREMREERERRIKEKKEREEKATLAPSAKKRKADAVETDEDEDPIVVPMRKIRRVGKLRKE